MKDFIEITLENTAKAIIAISSISIIEECPDGKSRVILKERVEKSGLNLDFIVKNPLVVIRDMIIKAQEQQ